MRKTATLFLCVLLFAAVAPLFGQGSQDADRIIMRLRPICNGGQGGNVTVAFDIKQRAGYPGGRVGGYIITITFNSSKLLYKGAQQMYNTNYWPGGTWFIDESYGPNAWFNQHSTNPGSTGSALPLNSTYWTPATDCSNNPLNDGFYEVLRYTWQVYPSANGGVDFAMFNLLSYKSGIVFQHGYQASATYFSDLQNNSNDSTLLIKNLIIPIEMSSFSAEAQPDRSVVLAWRTESETNNEGFDIERGDGANFERIGTVAGHGTTALGAEYQFVDRSPVDRDGIVFYRLKQIDADGTSTYSQIVSTRLLPTTVGLDQAFPNPVAIGEPATIPFSLAVPTYARVEVFDALGRSMAVLADGLHSAGRHQVLWDGRDASGMPAPAGAYFVRFTANLGGDPYTATRQFSIVR